MDLSGLVRGKWKKEEWGQATSRSAGGVFMKYGREPQLQVSSRKMVQLGAP